MTEQRYADEQTMTSVALMTPDLANLVGNVHGGHLIMLADNLAFICASRYAGGGAVTAALDRVDLFEPVHIGEAARLVARVVWTGHASIEVEVEVHAEELASAAGRLACICVFTMVALRDGHAAAVPALRCRTRDDQARYLRAKLRREIGVRYREEREGVAGRFDGLDAAALDALYRREGGV